LGARSRARFIVNDADLILSPAEKDVIRWAFMSRFIDAASVYKGFLVRRWATGPNKGKPKLRVAAQRMLGRGLLNIEDDGHWPRVTFTDRGLLALKLMVKNWRALDPDRYSLLIQELKRIPGGEP
jgi:hypothetical protein